MFTNLKTHFFKKYAAEFSRWNESRKPLELSSLELAFTDLNGKNYYRFPEALQLPIERWGKAKDYMQWMAAGLTWNELDMLVDVIDEGIASVVKSGKGLARAGHAIEEIRRRKDMIIHSELIYNFLAVHWVREDEKPEVWNKEIHEQKVEQFKIEVANADTYFFFQERELKKIYEPYNLLQSELTVYFQESIVRQEALKQILQTYLSKTESESTTKVLNQN